MKWEKYPFKMEKQYRLTNWDYSSNGYYFVTICTKDRLDCLGEINNLKITLSDIGKIANQFIIEIPKHFQKIKLIKFAIMPNHIHLLLMIDNKNLMIGTHHDNDGLMIGTHHDNDGLMVGTHHDNDGLMVGTHHDAFLQTKKEINYKYLAKKSTETIPLLIKLFKGSVKRECVKKNLKFNWQPRFHDHIVRNQAEFWAIYKYIENNVKNWNKDKDNQNIV